jgi:hypothetical protein
VPHGDAHGRYRRSMSKHYLILIERLVREGRPESEIDRIVRKLVADDEQAGEIEAQAAELPERRAA